MENLQTAQLMLVLQFLSAVGMVGGLVQTENFSGLHGSDMVQSESPK